MVVKYHATGHQHAGNRLSVHGIVTSCGKRPKQINYFTSAALIISADNN